MLKSEFKAARSANRLALRNAYRRGHTAFSSALDCQSSLMNSCKPRDESRPSSLKVYFFKTDRLGYSFNFATQTYSRKAA